MSRTTRRAASVPVLAFVVLGACTEDVTTPQTHSETTGPPTLIAAAAAAPVSVSGSGIIFTDTQIVHSEETTATGLVQRSTVAGQLDGDLGGSILFIATSVFDFQNGTLVNTGTQFFSGTVAGSEPVTLHDDSFRFEIDLNTGETLGEVHFSRSKDAPHKGRWFECDLVVVGTGITAEGDLTSDYTGECVPRGTPH